MRRTILSGLGAAPAILALSVTAAVAQDTSPAASGMAGPDVEVTAQEYRFEGLPTSVPMGTRLTLTNAGAEVHELIVFRRNDDVTESWEELLALPQEESLAKVTPTGGLFADPGEPASFGVDGTFGPVETLVMEIAQEGEYIAVCFIPQGTTTMEAMGPGPQGSPGASQPVASGPPAGPPHFLLGMWQPFTVTAAGTPPGPLPSPMGSAADFGSGE